MRAVMGFLMAAALLAAAPGAGAATRPVDLDVLFVGAHPDDEAFGLAVYGAWGEENGARTGVVTVTRGEGGGNAVGPEEGPALGLLREAEERRAVGGAGIEHVYNLDEVDFYYTVSAPLTRDVWEGDTLERVVRVVRRTRPEVIVTMDPSPTPGNHGHHQLAARLAVEAYRAAADPGAFRGAGRPWRVKRIFRNGATGDDGGVTGPRCPARFTPAESTDETFALWSGARAPDGTTWAQTAREAQRQYVSQGWAVFPDEPSNPRELGCDRFTQIASRVPYGAASTRRDAMLQGALVRAPGGLPLGTELQVAPRRFDAAPGSTVALIVRARGPRRLGRARVSLDLPRGWRGGRAAALGRLRPGRDATATLAVRVPAGAEPGRVRIPVTLRAGGMTGASSALVRVVPAVDGTPRPLPQVADFRRWARENAPQLDGLVNPVASLGAGETRRLWVDLENRSASPHAGTVALRLPDGFTTDSPTQPFAALEPGGTAAVAFDVTNTDPSLETGTQGGDYTVDIVTTAGGSRATQQVALNLVPVTAAPRAAATPVLDGVEAPGEYGAAPELDLSRKWEGDDPRNARDASGSAKLVWVDDAIHVVVHVTDDELGTVLPRSDAKRHWRTDSVEVAIDPRGDAENTSATFKVGVFPTTREGGPAAYRDADNRQGPVAETAPGFGVAARLRRPYTGYTVELRIPFDALPDLVGQRERGGGLNLFVYDSDTQDKTGQTRLGWSTWEGVQGDPYRWGRLSLTGRLLPAINTQLEEPVFPREAALSVDSPQSILQSARDGVALAGGPQARAELTIVGRPTRTRRAVRVRLRAEGRGVAHVFATTAAGRALGAREVRIGRAGRRTVTVRVPRAARARRVAVAFEAASGGTDSASAAVGTR